MVRDLGVIEDLSLVFGPGMTALTGETGAGKTLVVEAIELLMGGRADPTVVRAGASEAWVEGRFTTEDGDEVILARAVPADGRSRGYVNGRMASAATLAEVGADLVDLHGQHSHQSLLSPAIQRRALDAYAHVDREPLDRARAEIKRIDHALVGLGGDERARVREIDLLQFQVNEITGADLRDPDEGDRLREEESILGEATAWREAGEAAHESLAGDGGAHDAAGVAAAQLKTRGEASPFAEIVKRLEGVLADLADIAADLRTQSDAITEDPARLAVVQARRLQLRELRRKYGDTLAEVIAAGEQAADRLADLTSYAERAAELEQQRETAHADEAKAAAAIQQKRHQAARPLAVAVEEHLHKLAMGAATFSIDVDGPPPGDEVVFGLGANAGEPVLPLAKVASGGELARAMLAARLVLTAGPPTLVFDEVDAGVGGEAAVAVGRALAQLAREPDRQVMVVTHLAQVAAFADAQVAVSKEVRDGRTIAGAEVVAGDARVRELSRMLSGQPDSDAANRHAAELLALAAAASTGRS